MSVATANPHGARLARVRDALGRSDLDALLITTLPNVRYLTGFSGSNALVLVTPLDCLLFTDFRYATQVETEVSSAVSVQVEAASLWKGLWGRLRSCAGVARVGFESAHLRHQDFARLLEQGGRWQWRPTLDVVEALRAVKDAGELVAIERAVAMAEAAWHATVPQLRPGLTERQAAGILERALRDAGSEAFPFPSIVASGPQSALPHARAGERILARGDLLLMDYGAVADGYCSDLTRTVVLGRADARQRELYAIVQEANQRASGLVRGEMSGTDADALARDYIAASGWGEAFGHSLGHGIGLEVHEAPRLARSSDAPLPFGAVVTIEPGIYLPGWGGIRIEDDVLLAASGTRVLTSLSRDLLELP